MKRITELNREDLSKRTQKIFKSVKPTSSTDDKANAALALSVIAILPNSS